MDDSDGCLKGAALIIVLLFILFIGPGIWIICSSFESAAYNRLTGAKTTTWDAMFLELRVQEETQK